MVEPKRPILVTGVRESEIRALDSLARELDLSRAGLVRRLIRELVAAASGPFVEPPRRA
jgi:hypothetical protein